MRLYITVLLGSLMVVNEGIAQVRCGTRPSPVTPSQIQFEQWMSRAVQQYRTQRILSREPEAHYRIPVVVHIIHRGEAVGFGSNIPEAQVIDQLRILNEDFRRQNADTVNTRGLFRPVAASSGIEFVLARQDPDGLPTSGIVRRPGTQPAYSIQDENELGRISQWPTDQYLNIWVAPLRNSAGGSLLGFVPEASIPSWDNRFSNPAIDGVIIDYRSFGSVGELRPSANRGRTATHEVGHFLGLYHIWGDGGCNREDYIDDTPPQANSSVGCPADTANSCGSLDMYENFMDYTDDACMNMFTQGQRDRMRTVLTMIPRRNSLLTSPALDSPILLANEAIISQVISPSLGTCPGVQPVPAVAITNVGSDTISDITIAFRVEGELIEEVVFPISLASGAFSELAFSPLPKQWLPATGQQYQASFTITQVNGTVKPPADEYTQYTQFFVPHVSKAPWIEPFSDPSRVESELIVYNPDRQLGWERTNISATNTPNWVQAIRHREYNDIGAQDIWYTPVFDLSTATTATVSFRLAYAPYQEDTKPTRQDGLVIGVSTDCGATIDEVVYSQYGDELATRAPQPVSFVPTTDNDWRNEVLSLDRYAGYPQVQMVWTAVNGNGNNLYVDDVELFTTDYDGVRPAEGTFHIESNPITSNQLTVEVNLPEVEDVNFSVYSLQGKLLFQYAFSHALNQTYTFSTAHLSQGMYVLRMVGERGTVSTQRFIVR